MRFKEEKNQHGCTCEAGGRRTKQTRTDASYVNYGYDNYGQVQTALGYTSGGTPITSEQFGYAYDAAWNLLRLTNNGAVTTRSYNSLNQLPSPPYGDYTYDANGNLTAVGSRAFTYDDENQLVSVADTMYQKTAFTYDAKGRLRIRQEYSWINSMWSLTDTINYVYDGMQAIQMRGATISSYTRGLDLSLSLKGAGGIGGLLAQSTPAHSYYHSDGNGNITYLMKADQSLGASYRYDDAYGNVVTTSGTLSNPFRFSSKEWLPRISAYYYGYRFYYPAIQRWLNRDPIGERGGINLYGFAHNNPINSVDKDGHMPWGAGAVIGVGVGLGYCLDRYAACPLRVAAALYNAQSEADRVAPDGSTHAQRGTAIEGGDADALTHCIAACNLGKRPYPCMGADGALEVLQSHEKGNDIGTQIDRLNNEAGIGIGVGLAPGDSCTTKCLEALRNGMLKKIENGQIVSSSVL